MDLTTMDHSELEKTFRQAMSYDEEYQKLIPLRDARNRYLAPAFEKTNDGIFAHNQQQAALKDPEITKLQAEIDRANDRLRLAENPVPIKKKNDRQTIIFTVILVVIAIVAFIAGKTLDFPKDTTPQRTITMVYTVATFFAIAYVIYRYFYWKKYKAALITYAKKKITELAPTQEKLTHLKSQINEQYAENIAPFSVTFKDDDPAFQKVQRPYLAQQAIVDQCQAAYEAIPIDLRDKHTIQRFIQALHQDSDANWQSISENYLQEKQQRAAAIAQKKQAEQQQKLDAQNNTARKRNQRHLQQQHIHQDK